MVDVWKQGKWVIIRSHRIWIFDTPSTLFQITTSPIFFNMMLDFEFQAFSFIYGVDLWQLTIFLTGLFQGLNLWIEHDLLYGNIVESKETTPYILMLFLVYSTQDRTLPLFILGGLHAYTKIISPHLLTLRFWMSMLGFCGYHWRESLLPTHFSLVHVLSL